MKNVMRVTTHIRRRLEATNARDITRRSLIIIPARDGQCFHVGKEGDYWRTFVFVEGVQTYEAVQTPEQAFQAGRAFGEFQNLLVDLPGERLTETIPAFHNTRRRFTALQQAVQKDHYLVLYNDEDVCRGTHAVEDLSRDGEASQGASP